MAGDLDVQRTVAFAVLIGRIEAEQVVVIEILEDPREAAGKVVRVRDREAACRDGGFDETLLRLPHRAHP
jgi:predicted RNA-binding protein